MIEFREYGDSGFPVFVLHGGPGSPGYMGPVARDLAQSFRVFEPFQRGKGLEPLRVAQHIGDLDELLSVWANGEKAILVGHSWGAMLALTYAATYPHKAGPIVLIACGPFDAASRAHMRKTVSARIDDRLMARLEQLPDEFPDPDERMRSMSKLMLPIYSHECSVSELEVACYDSEAGEETWQDMLQLERKGVYPAAFAAIRSPVLMLHGTADPYPGNMIRANINRYLPQLEYREWEKCGHYPWLERAVSGQFLTYMHAWLNSKRT